MLKEKYEEDFKKRIVQIYLNENCSKSSLTKQHGMTAVTLNRWIWKYEKENENNEEVSGEKESENESIVINENTTKSIVNKINIMGVEHKIIFDISVKVEK